MEPNLFLKTRYTRCFSMSTPFCYKPDCKFNRYYVEDNIQSITEINYDGTHKETRRYMTYSGRYICENCAQSSGLLPT